MAIRKSPITALITLAVLASMFLPAAGKRVGLISTLSLVSPAYAQAAEKEKVDVPKEYVERYKKIAASVDEARIKATIKELSKYPSRVVGYPGADKAGEYVLQRFRELGLEDVKTEDFTVTVPIDKGSSLNVGGKVFQLKAMWPNLVRTSQLPPEGLDCHVVYAGYAKLPDMDGLKISGSAAMVEFNSGSEWLNAPRLGAKAVIFIEPVATMRGEAEAKFSAIPISIPRYWISRKDAEAVRAIIKAGGAEKAKITCSMPWERKKAFNVTGKITGTDPKLKDQVIVIHSHYDGMSVVPGLAPAADVSCGMAAMLELARVFKENPPKRSVWFIATSGHYMGLRGMRAYVDRHMDEYRLPGMMDKIHGWLNRKWPAGSGRPWLTLLLGVAIAVMFIRSTTRSRSAARIVGNKPGLATFIPMIIGALILIGVIYTAATWKGFNYKIPNPPKIYLYAGLDLTSQTDSVGIFYKGYFYDFREDIQNKFSDIASRTRDNAKMVGAVLGFDSEKRFNDGVNPIAGKNWRNFIPGKIGLDSEVITLAGARGISFVTTEDARALVDTPFDTFERVKPANVSKQTTLLACLFDHILRDPNDPRLTTDKDGKPILKMPISEPSSFTRMGLQGGFSELRGEVVMFDPTKSFVPNQPVPDCITVVRNFQRSFMGVRANMIELTNDKGEYSFPGVAPLTAYGGQRTVEVGAYKIDNRTGDITHAPDMGVYGQFYPTTVSVTTAVKEVPIIVFDCVATSIYDLIDPQGLRALVTLQILDGASNGEPKMYGSALAVPEWQNPHVEDMAVIFTPPNTRIKLIMGAGPAANRLLLINATSPKTAEQAEGLGYDVKNGGAFTETSYHVAKDLWTLDEFRIRRLAKYRIINEGLDKLHAQAGAELAKAEKARASNQYSVFDSYCRSAWGYECRAYPDVQKTAKDVVNGVLFYLALMLPFAYFAERLFFAKSDLKWQIIFAFGIFLVIFSVFRYVHPAFEITMNPTIVLLAFIMLALSFLVTSLITNKFEEQLKQFNRQMSGVHKADIGRMSVAAAAFSLGISNMRRRKARTVLTCITLILLTFTVLSFTSIVSVLRFNKVPAPGKPAYNGIMIRTAMWEPLQELGYRILQDEFGTRYPVAPRAWFFGTGNMLGEQSFLAVARGNEVYNAKGAVGLTPEEVKITHPDRALVAGRWFKHDDVYSIIIPDAMAKQLKVDKSQVGKTTVRFGGQDYLVIGIVNNRKFKALKDLDREPLTPVDFILMNKMTQQGKSLGEAGFREYTHLEPDNTFYIPYQTAINLGGDVRSIAIGFITAEQVKDRLNELMPRLGLNLYAGLGDRTFRYSSIAATSGRGFQSVFIPILIASLIVLNTMLGSVYERVKEIGIFSSIGLAPNHIAILFIAESLVYAILGAVAGYVLGQAASKILTAYNLLPGLYLNFSSMSAVWSTLIVVVVVIGSTLYPARKASEVATPAIDRSWKVPEPVGDVWDITLPFAVTGEQAVGVNGFLSEWFQAYEEYSIGDFVTQDVKSGTVDTEYGMGYTIGCKAWLAPFDLGVSQEVVLKTVPTDMEDVFEVKLTITRESGDISNWKRVNRRFLNTLRKQFLIWRTLRHEDRERYLSAEEPKASVVEPTHA